ncbi:uncharacterized protein NEMAJ01_1308 [Nematocida major]|uniref:uncharacterized protein n=1 Tax=Nematocida major TaxID=1912982 RepID=UPI002007C225|nr:uncharacterized protein NEMAJ01_1308 [Nematocida major]KAH9386412.1 hypothetical protein NEMAJ01_1308 [Nematocida major]
MHVEIYSIDYANERGKEIQEIERSIAETKKNKMLFQALPFHKRRRTASFDERRLPRECRRGERNKRRRIKQTVKDQETLLKAHTWYAKRFFMYKRSDMAVPFKRHSKSEGFIAKALKTRGVLCDASYNKVFVSEKARPCGAVFDGEYARTFSWSAPAEDKPEKDGEKSVIIAERPARLGDTPELKEVKGLSVFEVFGAQSMFCKDAFINCTSVEALLDAEKLAYVCMRDRDKSYVLVPRRHCMELLQKAVVAGIVPCSIQELQRIATETEKVVYPYDIPQNAEGKAFLEHMAQTHKEEQEKKPKGKREVVFGPLYEKPLAEQKMLLFVAEKGSFPRRSPVAVSTRTEDFVMDGSENVVGEVGRSSFCFAKGKTTGVMYVDEDVHAEKHLFVRNLKNKTFRRVECTPVTHDMIL